MNENQSSILANQWRNLVRGAVDPKHDWHWPVMSTLGKQDQNPVIAWPHLRTVVLRKTSVAHRTFEIHSDSRAGKIADLEAQPISGLLFYDQKSRTQLRASCTATVDINNAVAEHAWNQLGEPTQTQYLEMNQKHFAVITLTVFDIDWLWLAREGHQRLRFSWLDGQWHAQELKP